MTRSIPRIEWLAFVLVALFTASPVHGAIPEVAPEQLGLDADHLERIDGIVAEEIEAKHLPGCVVAIGRTGGIGFLKAYGHRAIEPEKEEMTVDTVFDMASLTKPIATATSIMILVERGEVRLRNPVAEYIPEFGENGKEDVTVEDLLVHRGGLIPDNSLKDYQDGHEKAWERIFALEGGRGREDRFIYSDVGFLVLGEIVHRVSGKSVDQFAAENIFEPLGMQETGYNPAEPLRERAAPTEKIDGKWRRGKVHDPRAALLDGVAGHAGLFSTAADLAIYCDAMLRASRPGEESAGIMSRATVAEMTEPREIGRNRRALGWDNRTGYSTNRGELMSDRAFGHGGFTGTAMWIDPELDLFVIFLSNRLHPDGEGSVNPLAGRIGTIAAAAINGPPPSKGVARGGIADASSAPTDPVAHTARKNPSPNLSPEGRWTNAADVGPNEQPGSSIAQPTSVLTGIDVLIRDDFKPLKGRKIGLITNHTGLDREGHRTIDLLANARGVELVALFSPEHGIAGALDHEGIQDARDPATGLPVHSLYDGPVRRPKPEHLKGIDTLVFDIQDVGARFYTYMSTMAWAMEAAGEQGLKFVVLDRPNPIGGVAVEGPIADAGRESFVGCHTIPVRHGMTVGEVARMYRKERDIDVDLEVIEVENWSREDYWDRTGLTWVNPSPNMRSLTEAVLYPGMGIWETTNISVGRGTDTPFEVLGAPWIDGRELAAELNAAGLKGVRFIPIEFTPDASKYKGEKCGGINVTITDRERIDSVAIGMEMACTLRRLYPLEWHTRAMDRLLINEEVRDAILDGADRAEIEELYKPELDEFLKRREKFLLYE
ncbi:MAG TPA: exo-beta-N-acetylmuramidase NamZ domain-containing protein [Lacipirellula sp.]